jgi:hypothetical protein
MSLGYGKMPYGLGPYGLASAPPAPPVTKAPGPYTQLRKWEALPPYLRRLYPKPEGPLDE